MSTITVTPDTRIDRLYQLLPAIYRMRDAGQGYPLQALLRVIAEQVNVVEDDIAQLYDNWFIETAEDWAVPYVADLIGYRPVVEAGPARAGAQLLNRILVPRREVANTIRYRRRKGTLPLLELLAGDVAGWPARAVEFFKLLARHQNINHLRLTRGRTADVRRIDELDLVGNPFDPLAHTVDVRRIQSGRTPGRFNIPSVGVFVWRLKSFPVTLAPAYCAEDVGPHCYTFSVLGQDAPLFRNPVPEPDATHIAEESNVPSRIRRLEFRDKLDQLYGAGKSLRIFPDGWQGLEQGEAAPPALIVAADLSGWQYVPPLKKIAVDPVLGRIVFPPSQLPKKGVRVSYHYGFSADIGGGEYDRPILNPQMVPEAILSLYRVGKDEEFRRISDALQKWESDNVEDAVIELTDSTAYVEPIHIKVPPGRSLQLRAANRTRPVIRLIDWQTDLPDALSVVVGAGSRFTLDGVMVTGRPVHVTGLANDDAAAAGPAPVCGSQVVFRHCTLVPGWGVTSGCEPRRPAEPSLELFNVRAEVRLEHSITGSIAIHEDAVAIDPIPLHITDSIVDAAASRKEAIGSPGYAVAHTVLTIQRSTVFGIVDVHAIERADDCIFMDCVNVARRQLGCMRFCYVPPKCRTPRRYHCQPDLVEQVVKQAISDPADQLRMVVTERLRVRPQFTSIRYGNPGYAQLALTCADEIRRGAEDESEMGVFHDLFQPQREASLRTRLDEFTPAGMDVGILFAN